MLYVVIVEGGSGREGRRGGMSAVRHLKQGPNLEGVGKKCDHPVWRTIEKELVSGSHFGTNLN